MSDDKMPMKQCRDCGLTKPMSDFWQSKASPDGRSLYCTSCFKARNVASAARRAAKAGRELRPRKSSSITAPDGMKLCPRCEQLLPLDRFVRNRSAKSGIGSYCRPCQNAKAAETIARLHGTTRHYHLKRRYGIGAADVERMLISQGWRCPVCLTALSLKAAHVDHDHSTGAVRGVLCFNCNGGLG